MSSEQKSENILTYREKSFCRVYKTDKNAMTKMSYIWQKNDTVWKLAYRLMFKYIPLMQKLLNKPKKNMRTNFKIPLISKNLEGYFTEMFYYCFIGTYFEVHL